MGYMGGGGCCRGAGGQGWPRSEVARVGVRLGAVGEARPATTPSCCTVGTHKVARAARISFYSHLSEVFQCSYGTTKSVGICIVVVVVAVVVYIIIFLFCIHCFVESSEY